MKKLLVRLVRQSPAMVVAMLALFVALTGTAVATTSALITGNQIKNSSITGLDVKNKSLTPKDFRGSVRGPRGLAGAPGATGAQGAQGAQGIQGPPGPFADALAPGATVRGNYMTAGINAGGNQHTAYSYGFQLGAAPTVHYINAGAASPAGCPGTAANPQASPGHLCVYEVSALNNTSRGICNLEAGGCPAGSAGRRGFAIFGAPTNDAVPMYIFGTWAVTAHSAPAAVAPSSGSSSTTTD